MIHSQDRMTGVTSLVYYLIKYPIIGPSSINMHRVITSMQQGHMRGVLHCLLLFQLKRASTDFYERINAAYSANGLVLVMLLLLIHQHQLISKCLHWLDSKHRFPLFSFLHEPLYGLRLESLLTLSVQDRGVPRPYQVPQLDLQGFDILFRESVRCIISLYELIF